MYVTEVHDEWRVVIVWSFGFLRENSNTLVGTINDHPRGVVLYVHGILYTFELQFLFCFRKIRYDFQVIMPHVRYCRLTFYRGMQYIKS